MPIPHRDRGWVAALVMALVFLAGDSVVRWRGIQSLTSQGSPRILAPDTGSSSGFEGRQHRLVVPSVGTDGYHWAMQAQQMIAQGGARVRHVDYDGTEVGRDVHWSSFLHWVAAAAALIRHAATGESAATSVESVFPWVGSVLLALLLIAVVPVTARALGSSAASLIALGAVGVFPVYEFFATGNFDHHGIAAFAVMASTLCLICGGAGWVRNATDDTTRPEQRSLLHDEPAARRWFIASGIIGGAGLWISAATEVPAIAGTVLAGFISTGVLARGHAVKSARAHPALWRIWGLAGGATSIAFYLAEYFPSSMSVRLEVNSPLYAIAWFAAGDLLYRACRIFSREETSRSGWLAVAGDALLIVCVPLTMILAPGTFTLRPGSLVLSLHESYITEFYPLIRQVGGWSWLQFSAGVGLLPLLALVPAAAVAAAKRVDVQSRAIVIVSAVPALTFVVLALRQGRWLGTSYAVWLCVIVSLVVVALRKRPRKDDGNLRRSFAGGIAFALVMTLVTLAVARDDQSSGAGIPLKLVTAAIIAGAMLPVAWGLTRGWTGFRAGVAGIALGIVILPFPALSLEKWIRGRGSYPISPVDLTQVVARDLAHKLRGRLGAERGVVASGPATTTLLIWFGGFRGIGTLYWENHGGLEAAADLFASPVGDSAGTDDAYESARALGVTHIVLFSWSPFATEYALLANGLPRETHVDDPTLRNALGPALLQGAIPPWLQPLSYPIPPFAGFDNPWALVLEVTPVRALEETATRSAIYCMAMNDEETALRQLQMALGASPDYRPALIALARIQLANPKRGDARATLQRIEKPSNDTLALEDRIGLASLYLALGDTARSRAATREALAVADERAVRRLPWDYTTANFIVLLRRFGLSNERPRIVQLATDLLDPVIRSQLESQSGR
jgi:hypothetical protein